MELVLAGLVQKSCMAYLDNILVFGTTFDSHLKNLTQEFARLREAGLRLKPQQCDFGQKVVTYLGLCKEIEKPQFIASLLLLSNILAILGNLSCTFQLPPRPRTSTVLHIPWLRCLRQ